LKLSFDELAFGLFEQEDNLGLRAGARYKARAA
jgi:hypothetical protein